MIYISIFTTAAWYKFLKFMVGQSYFEGLTLNPMRKHVHYILNGYNLKTIQDIDMVDCLQMHILSGIIHMVYIT